MTTYFYPIIFLGFEEYNYFFKWKRVTRSALYGHTIL